MLDLDLTRSGVVPKRAATIILVRDTDGQLEVFCVERSKQSRFLGGAIVFPGGKVDASDGDDAWASLTTATPIEDRASAVAACRETLEEATILLATGPVDDAARLALRGALAKDPAALRTFLASRGLKLDLAALHPFSRWVTPEAESRRFDTWFFVAVAPEGQVGAHDEHETTSSFWASPAEVLRRFVAGDVQLAPPTYGTLALLATCTTAAEVVAAARAASHEPICPRLVTSGDTMALTLPGDPEHEVRERRAPGASRFVLRGDRWLPEEP